MRSKATTEASMLHDHAPHEPSVGHAEQTSMPTEDELDEGWFEEAEDAEEDEDDSPFLIIVAATDETEREAITWALDEEGFLVRECEDRAELRALLKPSMKDADADDPADVILADERAIDVLFKFRRAERTTPIVLIASDEEDDEILDVAEDLDARILPSPFSAEDLIDAVRATLAASLADS